MRFCATYSSPHQRITEPENHASCSPYTTRRRAAIETRFVLGARSIPTGAAMPRAPCVGGLTEPLRPALSSRRRGHLLSRWRTIFSRELTASLCAWLVQHAVSPRRMCVQPMRTPAGRIRLLMIVQRGGSGCLSRPPQALHPAKVPGAGPTTCSGNPHGCALSGHCPLLCWTWDLRIPQPRHSFDAATQGMPANPTREPLSPLPRPGAPVAAKTKRGCNAYCSARELGHIRVSIHGPRPQPSDCAPRALP